MIIISYLKNHIAGKKERLALSNCVVMGPQRKLSKTKMR